jgi:hypothetical protein
LLIGEERQGSLPHTCPQEKTKLRMTSEKIGRNCLPRLISPILSFVMMFSHQDSALKTCDAAVKDMKNKDAKSDEEVEK